MADYNSIHTGAQIDAAISDVANKVDSSRVLTDVPLNAKFTDTVYTHPDTHSADIIVDGTTNKAYTATEKNKLSGIDTGANNYTHPTTSGNKHIPTGGASGQVLKYSADGTATWGNEDASKITVTSNTSYSTTMVRGIYATTTDLTAGTTSLTSGTIALVYE